MGETLYLEHPKRFNEKIQWLKIYGENMELRTKLTDKYLVREWIVKKIGKEYLVPLLGAYDTFDDINFDALPDSFVLKCNHGSGWNILVKNKNEWDKERAKRQVDAWMRLNFADYWLELQYLAIKPKIVIETYLFEEGDKSVNDYKVFCFNGEPKAIWVHYDRYTNHTANFYTPEWEYMPFSKHYPGNPEMIEPKPLILDKMLALAACLSRDFSHVRVDFYIVNGAIYFGEMTFTDGAGYKRFEPDEWDYRFGEMLRLPVDGKDSIA
jgi:hypothetical protein